MANYNPSTLPVSGHVPSLPTIKIQLEIYGIRMVDIMESTVSFKATFRQWWHDKRLEWDPKDYGGVNTTWIPSDPQIEKRSWVSDMSLRCGSISVERHEIYKCKS